MSSPSSPSAPTQQSSRPTSSDRVLPTPSSRASAQPPSTPRADPRRQIILGGKPTYWWCPQNRELPPFQIVADSVQTHLVVYLEKIPGVVTYKNHGHSWVRYGLHLDTSAMLAALPPSALAAQPAPAAPDEIPFTVPPSRFKAVGYLRFPSMEALDLTLDRLIGERALGLLKHELAACVVEAALRPSATSG